MKKSSKQSLNPIEGQHIKPIQLIKMNAPLFLFVMDRQNTTLCLFIHLFFLRRGAEEIEATLFATFTR